MSYTGETRNDIFSQRILTAVLWNIGLQTVLSTLLVFLIEINVLHPISWFSSSFYNIASFRMTFNIVPLVLVTLFQGFIYGRYYMSPPPKYFTRFTMFLNLFTIQNVIFCVLYALSGYFTMGLYSSLAGGRFSSLRKSCNNSEGQCLVEESVFLQFGGLWMGAYYFLKVHIFGTTMLIFPHIHQEKFVQIKTAISNVVLLGFKNALTPVCYYCVFYVFWGHNPRNVVVDVYSLYLEDAPLDNVINLTGSGIWISLWLYTSLFFITMYATRTVFNIVLTEPLSFPIISEKELTLHEALSQRSQFNGILAAQDLRVLAMTDQMRRQDVFTLSQPGGHPRNWNNILHQCLDTINSFSKELDDISNIKNLLNSSTMSSNVVPSYPSYVQQVNMRNLALSPKMYEKQSNEQLLKTQIIKLEDKVITKVKECCNDFLKKLSQKPVIYYFFGELSDSKLKYLLMQAQPVMWTCEGLAFMAAASLKEDKYGIVQNDLSIIISALVQLKNNLERLTKLGLIPKKHFLNDVMTIKMKSSLVSAVKRSIYKITVTFSKYINDIPLDADLQIAIQPFLLFKEA